jgi:hypothetical protein
MGGYSNSLGTLAVASTNRIVLGAGSLSFRDSSAVAWPGTLTVSGTLCARTLCFGNSAAALTSAQLDRINNDKYAVFLDADGYLRSWKLDGGILIVR